MTVLQQNIPQRTSAAVTRAAHADVAKWEAERTTAEAALAKAKKALASADVVDLAAAGILAEGVQAAERSVVTAQALEAAAHERLDAVLCTAALDAAGALRAVADAAWATYLEHAQRSRDLLAYLEAHEGTTYAPGHFEATPVTDQLHAAAVAADTAAADATVPLVGGYAAVRPGPVTGSTREVVLIASGPVASVDKTDEVASTVGKPIAYRLTVDGAPHDYLPYLDSSAIQRVQPMTITVPVGAVVTLAATRPRLTGVGDTFDPAAVAGPVDEG